MKQAIEIEVPDGKKAVWKDNKVIFEDIKPKFDPKTLKPFDRVLVSEDGYEDAFWTAAIFSHFSQGKILPAYCGSNFYSQVIPYNDDTKHLVGTTDEAPEYYRYWED